MASDEPSKPAKRRPKTDKPLASQMVTVWLEPPHVSTLNRIAKAKGLATGAALLAELAAPIVTPDNAGLAWHMVGVSPEDEAYLAAKWGDRVDEELDFVVGNAVEQMRAETPARRGRGRS